MRHYEWRTVLAGWAPQTGPKLPRGTIDEGEPAMADEDTDLQRIWSRHEVAGRLDVSLTTLWRMWRGKRFPPPMQLSPGRVGWLATTVTRWMKERDAATRG